LYRTLFLIRLLTAPTPDNSLATFTSINPKPVALVVIQQPPQQQQEISLDNEVDSKPVTSITTNAATTPTNASTTVNSGDGTTTPANTTSTPQTNDASPVAVVVTESPSTSSPSTGDMQAAASETLSSLGNLSPLTGRKLSTAEKRNSRALGPEAVRGVRERRMTEVRERTEYFKVGQYCSVCATVKQVVMFVLSRFQDLNMKSLDWWNEMKSSLETDQQATSTLQSSVQPPANDDASATS
jgi:hypothetical protein